MNRLIRILGLLLFVSSSLIAERVLSRERSFIAPSLVIRQEIKREELAPVVLPKPNKIINLVRFPNEPNHFPYRSKKGFIFLKQDDLIYLHEKASISTIRSFFSLNGAPYAEATGPIKISTYGLNQLQYYSSDMFGYRELTRSLTFQLDTAPPVINLRLSNQLTEVDGKAICEINTFISLEAKDDASGVRDVFWRNSKEGNWKSYSQSLKITLNTNHDFFNIEYYAIDEAGNISDTQTFSCTPNTSKEKKDTL